MPQTRVCNKHVVENIGRIANVGHCEGAEGGERLILARSRNLSRIEQVGVLMEGENVCKNLSGMPKGRKSVEDGDG